MNQTKKVIIVWIIVFLLCALLYFLVMRDMYNATSTTPYQRLEELK